MRWCYMAFGINREKYSGVAKKIEMQANAIGEMEEGCDILLIDGKSVDMRIANVQKQEVVEDVFSFLMPMVEQYDAFYFRWGGYNKIFNLVLKYLANRFVVFVEIPTYPIKDEMWGKALGKIKRKDYLGAIKSYLGGIVAQDYYLKKHKKWTDVFVLTTSDCSVKDAKTVNILNGIDPLQIPQRKEYKRGEAVKLLAVANISYWHGFDRILKGLAEYQGSRRVEFIIVGDGSELDELKRIVKTYSLEQVVSFRGRKFGEELNQCFEECDIAVGSLGLHRLGLIPSSLKSREYMARGIPFVMTNAEAMEWDVSIEPYVYRVSGDDSSININEIIKWFEGIDTYQAADKLRKFAIEHCTWKFQMKKVVDVSREVSGKKYERKN